MELPLSIPLLSAMYRLKCQWIPFLHGWERNTINPRLSLLADHLEFRVLFRRRRRYSDIELIDVTGGPAIQNLNFHFSGSLFMLSASLQDQEALNRALTFLHERGCPLSPGAIDFLGRTVRPEVLRDAPRDD